MSLTAALAWTITLAETTSLNLPLALTLCPISNQQQKILVPDSMDPYGPFWTRMDPYGPVWTLMDPYGPF